FCAGCVLGKSHRKPFYSRQDRPQVVGELINSDVNGPMSIDSINGFRYYVVFKDDFSRFVRIFFMKEKSEVATHLDTFLNECDTAGHKVKAFRKSSVPGKTPLKLWSDKAFDSFDYLRIFGSECYVNVPKNFRSKFDDKAVFGYFIGYVNEKYGYKVWVPSKHRVMKSRNVDFRPEKLCTTSNTIKLEFHHSSREVDY
ncbi:hypothetical protein CBL_21279, partial [Carabus blaptoides fortunei]